MYNVQVQTSLIIFLFYAYLSIIIKRVEEQSHSIPLVTGSKHRTWFASLFCEPHSLQLTYGNCDQQMLSSVCAMSEQRLGNVFVITKFDTNFANTLYCPETCLKWTNEAPNHVSAIEKCLLKKL